jgi:hypothetical protein
MRRWRAKPGNHEKQAEAARLYRSKIDPTVRKEQRAARAPRLRELRLKREYGLSVAAFEAMKAEQRGRCAICKGLPSGRSPVLHVDHDHVTGNVRALLCSPCNQGIGLLRDSHLIAAAAAKYLRAHAQQRLKALR